MAGTTAQQARTLKRMEQAPNTRTSSDGEVKRTKPGSADAAASSSAQLLAPPGGGDA